MRIGISVLLAAGVLGVAPGLTPTDAAEEASGTHKEITWIKSLDKAFAAAKKQKKILMVDFYATWCGPCKMLERHTFPDPHVTKLANASLVCAKIDVDRDRVGAAKHGIEAMPTILFFNPAGEMIARFQGAQDFLPANRAVKTIQGVLDDDRTLATLEKQIKAKPNDPDVALRLGTIYAKRQKLGAAEKLLAVVERADRGKDPKADKAVAARRKALEEVYDQVTYLRVALANTLLQKNELARAAKVMKQLLSSKYAPDDVKKQVRQILAQINKDEKKRKRK